MAIRSDVLRWSHSGRYMGVALLVVLAGFAGRGTPAYAQTVNSGSDGSDGALTLAAGLGSVTFDPADTARWGKVLDADGDGVFNFTTISIGSGTTLRLSTDYVARPVYWLASGAVTIAGVLDLNGTPGFVTADPGFRRMVPTAGSGGFSGGAGALRQTCGTAPPTAGDGPGGGAAATPCDGNFRHAQGGAAFFGNRYVLPLVGGSGGGGAMDDRYVSGGAGGGALLIVSSTAVTISGRIDAQGGAGGSYNYCAGSGGGGAIRLVAPAITGSGSLNVAGGANCPVTTGAAGQVRLEAFSISSGLQFSAGGGFVTRGTPVDPATFRPSGQVRVTAIGGVAVPPNAAGSFVLPDVTISAGTAVPVDIEATGVPPGTVVTLRVYPQSPSDSSIVYLPSVTTTLSGTLATSTATINYVFPYGFSRGTIIASWVQ